MSLILLTVGAIYVLEAVRKIPIHAKKQTAQRLGSQATYLPLKVNSAGVIPVIFAMASSSDRLRTLTLFYPDKEWAQNIANAANPSSNVGMVVYIVLIILFTYFYAFVQVNPEKMADNLKRNSYVPGIRPGEQTKKYITKVLYRLTFVGSIL